MGYQILLVDDEELALRGIEHGVDWNKIGIDMVYKTHNMNTAVRMLDTYDIDIVLTDIEMPEGTGIDLIRWTKANKPDVVCIFCTCHAEFSYAQEAVRMGAVDYLLKPVIYDELEGILAKALKMIAHIREQKERDKIFEVEADQKEEATAIDIIKRYIVENISADIQREELARLVYMNPDYLSRLFKKKEGIGLTEYMVQKKVELAKKLLECTRLSIVDIAARVGFSNSSYFIRIFKKKEGITPQQYRNQCSGLE